jgi:tetratricopeptide (TPR) repeat protein
MSFQELNIQGRGILKKYYDLNTGQWTFSKEKNFWEAIKYAHSKNLLGQGAKVSVVDRDFNMEIPKLSNSSILKTEPIEENFIEKIIEKILPRESHGTIVSLLLLMIAPEARLELYDIGRDPESGSKNAFNKISLSDVPIVNYSVGKPSDLLEFDNVGANHHCSICELVEPVIVKNKIVFAAVGNDKEKKFCPAIRNDVFSIGFLSEKSQINIEENFETVSVKNTSLFSQSPIADLSIPESSGVLGSSFAAPLIAGATCLLENPYDVEKYINARKDSAIAAMLFAQSYDAVSNSTGDFIGDYFESAIKKLPHLHEKNDEYCVGCSIFATPIYINAGLYYFFKNRLDIAEQFSAIAVKLAPWSSDAASFRAAYLRTVVEEYYYKGNRITDSDIEQIKREAVSEFKRAIKINPNHKPYQVALEEMQDKFKQIEVFISAENKQLNLLKSKHDKALRLWQNGELLKSLNLFAEILDLFPHDWLKEKNILIIKDNMNNLRGNLAEWHEERGQYKEAEKYYSDILEDFSFKEKSELKRIEVTYSIGQCLVFQQKFIEALPFYLKVIELEKNGTEESDFISKVNFYDELASCYIQIKEYKIANDYFEMGIQEYLKEKSNNQNKSAYGILLAKNALALHHIGKKSESSYSIEEAKQIMKSSENPQLEKIINEISRKLEFKS